VGKRRNRPKVDKSGKYLPGVHLMAEKYINYVEILICSILPRWKKVYTPWVAEDFGENMRFDIRQNRSRR
ncbi:MAG: hypothetical protein ABIA62_07745, partial [Candidatus Woesearchaeota archaeon]